MIYSTNWIERLNRDYKRILKIRCAIPSAESVLFLMGAVAMEKEYKSYNYPVAAFRDVTELRRIPIILITFTHFLIHNHNPESHIGTT